jgi:transcription initiation factor TFIIF subunit beta
VDNAEARALMDLRTQEAMKPKHVTRFIDDALTLNNPAYVQPGTLGAMQAFGGFIVRVPSCFHITGTDYSQKTKGTAAGHRPQLSKTARMPQNELLDKIFECFRRYKYWSMKALRAELQQPEAYLRETLEKVAVLAKSGPFATQWSLTVTNTDSNYTGGDDAMAPDSGFAEESDTGMDDDDDDEDVKFEDVVNS